MTDRVTKPALNATRRQFAAMGVAAVAATGIGSSASAAAPQVAERAISGAAMFTPITGEYPGLVMFASPAASRSANAAVAGDLAKQGWAVLLVDAPSGDVRAINQVARAHTALLAAQPGVAKAEAGYSLRSFDEAAPLLGIGKLPGAQRGAALFAMPVASAKSDERRQSLHNAARALYRLAA
jgi:hypothetical protein